MRPQRDFCITIVTDSRIIGILMILSGLVLNRWGLGWLLSPDHYIESSVLRLFILSGQVLLILAGLWLLLKNPGGNWPVVVRAGLLLVCVATGAFGGHVFQQTLYLAKVGDLISHIRKMRHRHLVHFSAGVGARVHQLEQSANLAKAEPELAATLYECQPFKLICVVGTMPALCACRSWHHADPLVIADGLNIDTGPARHLTN